MGKNPPTWGAQFVDLFLIELVSLRWAWRSMIVTGTIAPLAFIVMLRFFSENQDQNTLSYILVGNVILGLMFEMMGRLASHFAYIRFAGTLDYFATLPIKRMILVAAAQAAFLLMSLPSTITTIIVGSWVLDISLNIHPLILIVIPLAAIPLSAVGALIGTWVRSIEQAAPITSVLTLIMLGLGPVVVPPDRLPDFMIVLGRLSPATYAASALRQVLVGPLEATFWRDIIVLLALAVAALWLVERRLDWRQRS